MVQNTMNFHYGKHHMAYATNMNKQIEGTDLDNKPLEDVCPDCSHASHLPFLQLCAYAVSGQPLTPNEFLSVHPFVSYRVVLLMVSAWTSQLRCFRYHP